MPVWLSAGSPYADAALEGAALGTVPVPQLSPYSFHCHTPSTDCTKLGQYNFLSQGFGTGTEHSAGRPRGLRQGYRVEDASI